MEAPCAEKLKEIGNKAYLEGKDSEAEQLYTSAIQCSEKGSEYSAGSTAVLHVLHSNRSAARLRQKKVFPALEDAEEAIRLQPRYAKAWGRKAAALSHLEQWAEVGIAAQEGLSIDPANSELKRLLDAAEKATRATSGTGASTTAPTIGLTARRAGRPAASRKQPLDEWFPPPLRRRWIYKPSADGQDHNLLILFHGLGDKPEPFSKLAQQMALPQTATLALAGPQILPETDGGAAWFTAFDEDWELIPGRSGERRRVDSLALTRNMLQQLLEKLSTKGGWAPSTISLFGFSQGGTVALDFALHSRGSQKLAGCVSIAGALLPEMLPLSGQELAQQGACCKGLITHGDLDKIIPRSLIISSVEALQGAGLQARWQAVPKKGHCMINSKEEMAVVMAFWAETLKQEAPSAAANEEILEIQGGLEVDGILRSRFKGVAE